MKIFDINSLHGDQFFWLDKPPDGYNGIIIANGSFHTVEAGCGYMAMQHLERPGYSIWLSDYLMKSRRKTHVREDYSAIEFSLIIHNSVLYDLSGFGNIDQRETQFNISYLTEIDSKVQFEANRHYTTFDIHCSFAFMENMSLTYPRIINPLLDDMLAGRRHQVFPRYIYAPISMIQMVDNIMRRIRAGDYIGFMLDLDVQWLIASALTIRQEMLGLALKGNFDKVDKMNMISNILLKDLTMFPHIKALAKIAQMNDTTFKNTFKAAHQTTPHGLWSKHRLDSAHNMIVNLHMPVKEVALELGYGSLQDFSKQFRKRFQVPPSRIGKK